MADAGGMSNAGYWGAAAQGIGTLVQAFGYSASGRAARQAAEQKKVAQQFQAVQLEQQAQVASALSQRAAAEDERQGRFQASRSLAVAAASGGGVTDPTVVNLIANTKGEAHYRANVSLYEGETRARSLRLAALSGNLTSDWEMELGARTEEQYNIAAAGTIIKGAGSLYAKYGMGDGDDGSGGLKRPSGSRNYSNQG